MGALAQLPRRILGKNFTEATEHSISAISAAFYRLRLTYIETFFLCSCVLASTAYGQDIYSLLHREFKRTADSIESIAVAEKMLPLALWEIHINPSALKTLLDQFDNCVEANWISEPRNCRITAAYRDFLKNANWGRKAFSALEQSEFDHAVSLLFIKDSTTQSGYKPSPGYMNYHSLLSNYQLLKAEWDRTPPAERTAAMAANLTQARQKLENQGQQAKYKTAESKLKNLLARDYSKSIQVPLKQVFTSNLDNNGEPRSRISPTLSPRMNLFNWKELKVAPNTDKIGTPPFGYEKPDALAGLGVFSSDGKFLNEIPFPEIISIVADYARVNVVKPWLDLETVKRTAGLWMWPSSIHLPLSSAELSPSSQAPLTFLPISYYVIRAIEIEANWTLDAEAAISNAITAGNVVRLGPILINYPIGPASHNIHPTFDSATRLKISGYQIAGFAALQLPPLPDPSPVQNVVFHNPLPDFPFLNK